MAAQDSKTVTRVFRSGNSQAVRIPRELAFDDVSQEVEIERKGEVLLIRPVHREKLTDLAEVLAMFSHDFMAEGREFHEQEERDWDVRP